MPDDFEGKGTELNSPASRIITVAPQNSDLPNGVTRALYVGAAGNVAVVDKFGNASVIISGPNQYHPVRVARVSSTGTTATGILALY